MGGTLTTGLVRKAVSERDPASVREVIGALTPIVHARVARVLLRLGGAARGRDLRQEIEDMVQEVFGFLLADGGRRLLAWDPEQGSARTYFGLLAERCVLNILTSRKRNPWTEDPAEEETLELEAGSEGRLEETLAFREVLRELGRRLLDGLNARDRRLFEATYVQGLSDDEIREELGLGRDALYQARSRLLGRVRKLAAGMGPEVERLCGGGS